MSLPWLADADRDTFWAHHAWSRIDALPQKERHVIVLPVFGFADHGLGLPLDAEEIAGAALLRRAVEAANAGARCQVLPPLRFCLAPYPSTFFGIDPDTAHEQLHEIASGVKSAGFQKLLFLNTSPWNEELIAAAALDIRVALGLETFVVQSGDLGPGFHPADPRRARSQAIVSHLLGAQPKTSQRAAEISDEDFRPGNYRQPAPLALDPSLDGAKLLADASAHLARLLHEIAAWAPPTSGQAHELPAFSEFKTTPPTVPNIFPRSYRSRYLPAFTRDALESLPDKERALIIIPTGSIEQHGHHLPVGVDSILGQAWLEAALAKLPAAAPVYVAPPLTYGKSNEHVGFAGTLSISAKTLRRVLLATAAQLKALGFRQLAVLNTHGGNSSVVIYTLREIQTTLGLRAGMLGQPYKPDLPAQEAAYGFHAGEWETSLMLHAASELVDMTKAVCEFPARLDQPGELRPENAPATFAWMSSDVSRSGVMGDATAATAAKGARWIEAGAAALAARIEMLLNGKR